MVGREGGGTVVKSHNERGKGEGRIMKVRGPLHYHIHLHLQGNNVYDKSVQSSNKALQSYLQGTIL